MIDREAEGSGKISHFVRGSVLIAISQVAVGLAMDWRAIRDELAIPAEFMNPLAKIPAQVAGEALNLLAARSGRRDLGLRVAEQIEKSMGSPVVVPELQYGLRAQPTVADVIKFYARNAHLQNNTEWNHVEEVGQFLILKRGFKMQVLASNPFFIDLHLANSAIFLRGLLGRDWRPYKTCFSRPRPADETPYREIFGSVEFDREFDGHIFDKSQPYIAPLSDPESLDRIEEVISARSASPSISLDDIRDLTARMLPDGECTLERLSAALGVERRTVQRRLKAHGLTFSELIDRSRMEAVEILIRREDHTLTRLVSELGFSSISTFSRWFRQSYGMTASDYRKRRVGATEAERLYALMSRTRDMVLGVGDGGTILFANTAARRLRQTSQNLVGEDIHGLVYPDDHGWIDAFKRAWAAEPHKQGEPFGQCRFATQAGDYAWCEYQLNPIFNHAGQICEVLVVLHPLGDRKKSEDEAALLALLLGTTDSVIFLVEASGQITVQCGPVAAITPQDHDNLLGASVFDLFDQRSGSELRLRMDRIACGHRTADASSFRLRPVSPRISELIASVCWADLPSGFSSLMIMCTPDHSPSRRVESVPGAAPRS